MINPVIDHGNDHNPTMKRITIHDVAAAAGVSYQTVSRVINERPDVSEETRRHVLDIIQKLGFQPNTIARGLRGRSSCLGVVASGLDYFGPSGVLTGVERQSSESGYSIFLKLIRDPENGDSERILNELLSHRVEGIIWAVPEIGNNDAWVEQKLCELEVPIVFISTRPRQGVAIVDIDNAYGARLATKHLLEQDCRNIGLITGPGNWWDAHQREVGWREALNVAGLPPSSRQVAEGDWSTESGERAFEELLEKFPEMDAVFASNDQMALGVLQVIYRQRKRIPRDLALVGFDDIPQAAYFLPPLTTIRQDLIQLGGVAVESLCRMLDAHNYRQQREPGTILVKPTLIVRESSLNPRLSQEVK